MIWLLMLADQAADSDRKSSTTGTGKQHPQPTAAKDKAVKHNYPSDVTAANNRPTKQTSTATVTEE